METGTGFRRALKPTKPHRHISPASEQFYSSSDSRATTLESSSFESELRGTNSSSLYSRATSYGTERAHSPLNADDMFTRPDPVEEPRYNDAPEHAGGQRDPGGDWGRSRHLSAPHNWWEDDLEKRRKQLKDLEFKRAVRQAADQEMRKEISALIQGLKQQEAHHRHECERQRDRHKKAADSTATTARRARKRDNIMQEALEDEVAHFNQVLHLQKEIAWEKHALASAKPGGYKRAMTVGSYTCEPRETFEPTREPSTIGNIAHTVEPDDPAHDAQMENTSTTQAAFQHNVLAAMCVVS